MSEFIKVSLGLFIQALKGVVAAELGFTDPKAGAAKKQWVLDQLHAYVDSLPSLKVFTFDAKPFLKEGLDKLVELALSYAKAQLGN